MRHHTTTALERVLSCLAFYEYGPECTRGIANPEKTMTQLSGMSVNVEMQKTLSDIQDVTVKIKRELTMINELIRNKGNLCVAVDEANKTLARVAQELGIEPINELLTLDDNQENLLNPATVDGITQRLMSIMDT